MSGEMVGSCRRSGRDWDGLDFVAVVSGGMVMFNPVVDGVCGVGAEESDFVCRTRRNGD